MTTKHRFFHVVRCLLLWAALHLATSNTSAQEFSPGEPVDYKSGYGGGDWERGKILRAIPGTRQYIVIEKPTEFFPEGSQRAYNPEELRRPLKCSKCQAMLLPRAVFCGECGTGVSLPGAMKACPSCGNKQADGAFCAKCGGRFDGTAGPQKPPTPPAPAPMSPGETPPAPPPGGPGAAPAAPDGAKDVPPAFIFIRDKGDKVEAVEFFHPEERIYLFLVFDGERQKGAIETKFFHKDQLLATVPYDLATLTQKARNDYIKLVEPVTQLPKPYTPVLFSLTAKEPWAVSKDYRVEASLDGRPLGASPFSVVAAAPSPQEATVKTCASCGNQQAKGAFCGKCGTKFERACAACGNKQAKGAFCGECGAKLEPTAPPPAPGDGPAPAPPAPAGQAGIEGDDSNPRTWQIDLIALFETNKAFMAMLDAGQYDACFEAADESFRDGLTKEAWAANLTKNRAPLGRLTGRTQSRAFRERNALTGGRTFVLPATSSFENGSLVEELRVVKSADGKLRVSDYTFTLKQ